MDLHIFKSQIGMFDPVSLLDQYVCVNYLGSRWYRKVDFFEAIPPFQCIDVGAVLAATVSARTAIGNLDMPDEEFGLFRWYVLDNAQIRLFLPTGVAKNSLKNIQAVYDMNTIKRDPNLVSTEIAVWEDNRPSVEAINGMDYNLQAVRLIAMGYRYHSINLEAGDDADPELVALLKSGKIPVTNVICSGRGQG